MTHLLNREQYVATRATWKATYADGQSYDGFDHLLYVIAIGKDPAKSMRLRPWLSERYRNHYSWGTKRAILSNDVTNTSLAVRVRQLCPDATPEQQMTIVQTAHEFLS